MWFIYVIISYCCSAFRTCSVLLKPTVQDYVQAILKQCKSGQWASSCQVKNLDILFISSPAHRCSICFERKSCSAVGCHRQYILNNKYYCKSLIYINCFSKVSELILKECLCYLWSSFAIEKYGISCELSKWPFL